MTNAFNQVLGYSQQLNSDSLRTLHSLFSSSLTKRTGEDDYIIIIDYAHFIHISFTEEYVKYNFTIHNTHFLYLISLDVIHTG